MKAKVGHERCMTCGGSMAHKRFGAKFCGLLCQSRSLHYVNKTVTLVPDSSTQCTKSKRAFFFSRWQLEGDKILHLRMLLARSANFQTSSSTSLSIAEETDFSILELEYRDGEYIEFLAARHGMTMDAIEALTR